jgi:hypothetical protein
MRVHFVLVPDFLGAFHEEDTIEVIDLVLEYLGEEAGSATFVFIAAFVMCA